MNAIRPQQTISQTGDSLPPDGNATTAASAALPPTPAGQAALAAAQALARKATAPATLRAYKADWTHLPNGAMRMASSPSRQHQPPLAPTSPASRVATRRQPFAGGCPP